MGTVVEVSTMGRSDRRGFFAACWPSVVVFLVCLGSGHSFYYREYGVVKPDDPYLLVDEDLILFCNLTKLEMLEDSTYLYFTRNGVNIPAHYVDILTTRSVRLRYPIRQPEDEGHFVCWLRQERGNPRTIGSQHVKADYPLATVKEVNCTVYNWENMTCQWELGREYHHPEYIAVSLVWTISGTQKDCPKGHMTNTSCTWVRGGQDRFLPGHRYIMSVAVENKRRNMKTRSHTFHILTDTIVKPNPVANLHRSQSNATCLWLRWNHSDTIHDKVAYVQYLSQWNSSHWHKLETIFFKRGPGEAKICGLTPFTEYTIRVAVKPLPRGKNDLDGYRSEWKYIEKVRTDPSVPEVSPEMCAGCFTDVFCERPHCRNVIVYWKHIPWALRRSVIHSYQLTYTAQQQAATEDRVGLSGNVTTLYPNTSQLLPLRNDTDYTVQLYAVTSDHKVSRNHSSLLLVAKKNKPAGPDSLIVETDYGRDGRWSGQFDLRWSDAGQSTASFLVAWCRGSTAVLKCHHEDQNQVQWQEVSSSSSQFQISVSSQAADKSDRPHNYIVGVTRQVRRPDGGIISSGLTWARCVYLKNAAPRALPESVDFSKVFRAGTLRVTWTYRACNNQGNDAYVTRFIIYYCVITDTANNRCKGSEYNTTARREARSVLLEDLEQGAYYRVSMAADSQWGTGQRTQPVYSRVLAAQQQEEPRDFTVIGVILAIVIIIVLILIGLCKVRRRFQNQEKFISSFGDLPSLPPDSAVKSFKDRPLPQVPQGTSASSTSVVYTSNVGSAAGGDKRLRGGKHKSITSETSLLGHEEASNDEDSKRRHKSGNNAVSERSKLLSDDSTTQESSMTMSKYDSDSGAESRYSSEDHDYASVEGGSGSAEEGGGNKSGTAVAGGNPRGEVATPDDAASKQPHWKAPPHKPAPTHSPPPPPPSVQSGYSQATLMPEQNGDLAAACAVSSFRPQNDSQALLKSFNTMGKSQRTQHPAQLTVALEPVQSSRTLPSHRPQASGGYPGSEDTTLPRRLPGSKLKHYPPGVQDTPFTTAVDPYASTSVTSFSSHLPPPPAPPPYHAEHGKGGEVKDAAQLSVAPPGQPDRGMGARGHTPTPTLTNSRPTPVNSGASGVSDGGRASGDSRRPAEDSEPIYSPPWESSLVPFTMDNRPLSEYMLKLPQTFFDSSLHVNDGPTTEL